MRSTSSLVLRRVGFFGLFVALGGTTLAMPGAAAASSMDDAAKKVAALNLDALEQYDLLEFEAAKKLLLEAVTLAEKEELGDARVAARTHMHLGAVYIVGFKDKAKGLEEMQKAVRMDPELKMTPSIRSKEALKAFDRARADYAAEKAALEAKLAQMKKERAEKEAAERARVEALLAKKAAEREAKNEAARKAGERQVAAAPAKAPPEATKPDATKPEEPEAKPEPKAAAPLAEMVDLDTVEGLRCPSATELPARRPLALRCALDKTIDAAAVFAFYRPIGREDYTPQILKKSPKGWWEAVVTGDVVATPGVEIYFEARDKKGRPIAADGNAASPKQVSVRPVTNLSGAGAARTLAASVE